MASKRTPVTREGVTAAALRLLEANGLELLSMRTLAAELGVTAMALYRYYPNKEALLADVLDLVLAEMEPPPPGPWEERCVALAGSFRRTLLAHPHVLPLFAARPAGNPEAMRLFELGLTIFQESGLPRALVLRAYYAVQSYTLGFVTTEVARLLAARATPPGEEPADPYARVPADRFPLVARYNPIAPMLGEEQFLFGLRAMLTGLRAFRQIDPVL